MSSKEKNKSIRRVRLNNEEEGCSPPWQAYFHLIYNKKFYYNKETKDATWEHPSTYDAVKPKVPKVPINRKRAGAEPSGPEINKNGIPMDVDEPVAKRKRKLNTSEVSVFAIGGKISPSVPWSKDVNRRRIIPYRGCCILDTNVIFNHPEIVKLATEKQVLTIIPYCVVLELDGLKRRPSIAYRANDACRAIQKVKNVNDYYLELETSAESSIHFEQFHVHRATGKDDFILKSAVRCRFELLSVSSILNIYAESIVFVTNDINLSLKAQAHNLIVANASDFMNTLQRDTSKKELVTLERIEKEYQETLAKFAEEFRKLKRDCPKIVNEELMGYSKEKSKKTESVAKKKKHARKATCLKDEETTSTSQKSLDSVENLHQAKLSNSPPPPDPVITSPNQPVEPIHINVSEISTPEPSKQETVIPKSVASKNSNNDELPSYTDDEEEYYSKKKQQAPILETPRTVQISKTAAPSRENVAKAKQDNFSKLQRSSRMPCFSDDENISEISTPAPSKQETVVPKSVASKNSKNDELPSYTDDEEEYYSKKKQQSPIRETPRTVQSLKGSSRENVGKPKQDNFSKLQRRSRMPSFSDDEKEDEDYDVEVEMQKTVPSNQHVSEKASPTDNERRESPDASELMSSLAMFDRNNTSHVVELQATRRQNTPKNNNNTRLPYIPNDDNIQSSDKYFQRQPIASVKNVPQKSSEIQFEFNPKNNTSSQKSTNVNKVEVGIQKTSCNQNVRQPQSQYVGFQDSHKNKTTQKYGGRMPCMVDEDDIPSNTNDYRRHTPEVRNVAQSAHQSQFNKINQRNSPTPQNQGNGGKANNFGVNVQKKNVPCNRNVVELTPGNYDQGVNDDYHWNGPQMAPKKQAPKNGSSRLPFIPDDDDDTLPINIYSQRPNSNFKNVAQQSSYQSYHNPRSNSVPQNARSVYRDNKAEIGVQNPFGSNDRNVQKQTSFVNRENWETSNYQWAGAQAAYKNSAPKNNYNYRAPYIPNDDDILGTNTYSQRSTSCAKNEVQGRSYQYQYNQRSNSAHQNRTPVFNEAHYHEEQGDVNNDVQNVPNNGTNKQKKKKKKNKNKNTNTNVEWTSPVTTSALFNS